MSVLGASRPLRRGCRLGQVSQIGHDPPAHFKEAQCWPAALSIALPDSDGDGGADSEPVQAGPQALPRLRPKLQVGPRPALNLTSGKSCFESRST